MTTGKLPQCPQLALQCLGRPAGAQCWPGHLAAATLLCVGSRAPMVLDGTDPAGLAGSRENPTGEVG